MSTATAIPSELAERVVWPHEPDAPAVNPLAVQLLPADVCRLFGLLALDLHDGVVTVAMAEPSAWIALAVVKRFTMIGARRALRPVYVEEQRLRLLQDAALGPDPLAPEPVPEPPRPGLDRPLPAHPTASFTTATRAAVVGDLPLAPHRPAPASARVATVTADGVTPVTLTEAPAGAPDVVPIGGRLGGRLVDDGLVTTDQLAAALVSQARLGDQLGRILTHAGVLSEDAIAGVLSEQFELELLDLADADPMIGDADAVLPEAVAMRHRVVPLERPGRDGALRIAMSDPADKIARSVVAEHVGRPVEAVLVTERTIDELLQKLYAERFVDGAIAALQAARPEECANEVLTRPQRLILIGVALLVVLGLVTIPIVTIIALNVIASFFYITFSGYKLWLSYDSLSHDNLIPVSQAEIDALDDRTLPVITILMPLYREGAVLPKLMESIAALDYPATRLDVKLVMEEDDDETAEAIAMLDLPPHFKRMIVPYALPMTKPKACNYGLAHARGELTVIYDAEDRPDPDQLKKVVVAFHKADPSTVCVQCKLNYYNREQNLLTRWFTTEYSMWFDIMLPGLDAQDAPIPLGGTSNHFLTSELVSLGAWDPFNVAEDADLGIRLNRAGWRTAMVDSTTYEEANSDLPNWIRQRSRWVKGYLQTWLVHMRHPVRLARQLGLRNFVSFNIMVGGTPLVFLLNPLYWGLTTLWLLTEAHVLREVFPSYIYFVASFGLLFGNFVFAYANAAGAMHRGYFELVKFALISPLYWGFISIAAWKGFIQLFTRPFYWEKTVHGLFEEP